jgi:hypothetical protein
LRVWNDDTIKAGTGFPDHAHRDMEIITYVREGAITHRDDLGNEGRTEAGDVQVMSAGSGVRHSEYNLEDGTTRIFQIWIVPGPRGRTARWEPSLFPGESGPAGSLPWQAAWQGTKALCLSEPSSRRRRQPSPPASRQLTIWRPGVCLPRACHWAA